VGGATRGERTHLSAKLRELRQARFLSQAELARKAGVSVMTIKRLESGLSKPYGRTIRLLAAALAIEAAQLAVPQDIRLGTRNKAR